MKHSIRFFSGKSFSTEDIELIKWTVKKYPQLARRELAETICEFLDWVTDGGNPKHVQCGAFLERLETEGMIELPEKKKQKQVQNLGRVSTADKAAMLEVVKSEPADISECGLVELVIADDATKRRRWRMHVEQYHMLGYKQTFGCRIQYFIVSEGVELGCMQFSASSWALKERDHWIGWSSDIRKKHLRFIINNSRFLIYPWVHVPNLASRALSAAARRIEKDWLQAFCYAPVLLETFVDTSHFKGTCYKAANWIYLGDTQGRGRNDRNKESLLTRKAIYMYPLRRDFRAVLLGEKPWKAVNPDE